jgi:hypothetical protein
VETKHPRVSHIFLHLQWLLLHMFDLLLLFRCFPEVWRGRFGLFLCHFLLLALAFHPPG